MGLPTKTALESDGVTEFEMPLLASGGQARADSVGVGLSDEDRTLLTAVLTELESLNGDTSSSLVHTKLKPTHKVFSIDATAVAAGDILADTETVSAAMLADDAGGFCYHLTLYDLSDQAASALALRVVFLNTATSLGSENAAPSIADGDAPDITTWIDIVEADWIDWGAFKMAKWSGREPVHPLSGTDDIAVAIVAVAGQDYSAATDLGITFHIG